MTVSADDARDELSGVIKIIGTGQSLRGDDAAGLAAVRFWQERCLSNKEPGGLQVELAELPGIGLLNLLEGARLAIVIDAVHSEAMAGKIHLLSIDQLESFKDGASSAHGWGVAESLSLGQLLMPSRMPEKLFIIGIEAGDLSLGGGLSPEVEEAFPEVSRLIEQLISSE